MTTTTVTTATTFTAVPLPNGAKSADGLLLYMIVSVTNNGFDGVDAVDKPVFRRTLKSECEAMLAIKYELAETVACRVTDYSSISYRRSRRAIADTVNVTMSALFKSTNAATDAFARTNSQAGRIVLQNKTVATYNKALKRVGRSFVNLANATVSGSTTHTVELRGVAPPRREDWTWLYVVSGFTLFTLTVLTLAWIKHKNNMYQSMVHEEMLQMQDPDGWFKHRFSEATVDGRRSSVSKPRSSVTPFEVVRRSESKDNVDPFSLLEEGDAGGSGKDAKPAQVQARKSLKPPRLSKNKVTPIEVIRGPADVGSNNEERGTKPPQRKVGTMIPPPPPPRRATRATRATLARIVLAAKHLPRHLHVPERRVPQCHDNL
jgi:hypothetical protein